MAKASTKTVSKAGTVKKTLTGLKASKIYYVQVNQSKAQKSRNTEMDNFQRTELQKEIVIQRLKERGCRMTKQRKNQPEGLQTYM